LGAKMLLMVKKYFLFTLIFIVLGITFTIPVSANSLAPDFRDYAMMFGIFYLTAGLLLFTSINLFIEVLVLYFLGLRERRTMLTIVAVNLISWPIFYYLVNLSNLQFLQVRFLMIVVLEIIIIVIETLVIYFLNREHKLFRLFLKVGAANIVSAIIGTLIFYLLVYLLIPIAPDVGW
jgi:hypothetical protein